MINFGNKINIMILAYPAKINLIIRFININIEKIDDSQLKTYKIISAKNLVK